MSHRLAQRPGSYVVLEYRRKVLMHEPSAQLSALPMPTKLQFLLRLFLYAVTLFLMLLSLLYLSWSVGAIVFVALFG